MKQKMIAQCLLESDNERREGWLDATRIKVGYSVTLKDSAEPKRLWKIILMSDAVDANSIKTEHDSKAIFEKDFHGRFKGLNELSEVGE